MLDLVDICRARVDHFCQVGRAGGCKLQSCHVTSRSTSVTRTVRHNRGSALRPSLDDRLGPLGRQVGRRSSTFPRPHHHLCPSFASYSTPKLFILGQNPPCVVIIWPPIKPTSNISSRRPARTLTSSQRTITSLLPMLTSCVLAFRLRTRRALLPLRK